MSLARLTQQSVPMQLLLDEPVDGAPLPAIFSRACALHRQQDQAIRLGPEQVERALTLCRRCAAEVRAAGLFSANEDAEDLATADVKYLLAPFFLAELLSAYPVPPQEQDGAPADAGRPAQRVAMVEEALVLYSSFLDVCQQYGMLGAVGKQLYLQDAHQVCVCMCVCV
jgi:immunoglobulin-binding protein 1